VSPEARPLDAEGILRRLTARGVDFVVIGGIAAVLHGGARNTFDLDVCFASDAANLAALAATLIELGARLKGVEGDVPFVADAATLRRVEVLTLDTCLGELDVLAFPAGAPPYERLRRNADRYDLGDFSVLVASVGDLVAMKLAAGRPKDLADVEELQAISRLRKSAQG
jgi:nucleotidyltransferase AbiEii toxin of type IV toxin-antitoxin system